MPSNVNIDEINIKFIIYGLIIKMHCPSNFTHMKEQKFHGYNLSLATKLSSHYKNSNLQVTDMGDIPNQALN